MHTQADKHTQKKSQSHGWAISGGTATFRKCGPRANEQFNDTPASHGLLSQELPPLSGLSADTHTRTHVQGYLFFQSSCRWKEPPPHFTIRPALASKPWSFKWSAALINYAYKSVLHISFPSFSLPLSLSFSSFPDGASVIKLMTSLAVLRSNYWKKSDTSK